MGKHSSLPVSKTNNIFPIISQTMARLKDVARTNLYVPLAWVGEDQFTENSKTFLQTIDPEFFRSSYPYFQNPKRYIRTSPIWGYVINGPVLGSNVNLFLAKLVDMWRSPETHKPYINSNPNWAHDCVMVYDLIAQFDTPTQSIYIAEGGVGSGVPHPTALWVSAGLLDVEQI